MGLTDFGQQEILNMNSFDKQHTWLLNFYSREDLQLLTKKEKDELYISTLPKKVKMMDLKNVDVSSYRVNSLDGFVEVKQWREKGIMPVVEVKTTSGLSVVVSEYHLIELANDKWKYSRYLLSGDKIKTKTGIQTVLSISKNKDEPVFDFHIGHENHRYFTNDISSHNSGVGKSLFLQNLAANWIQMGLSGVYITFELNEGLTGMRLDSMTTGTNTKCVFKDIDNVELKVKLLEKSSGKFQLKYLQAQSTVNDIRAYCKELQIKTKNKIDFICVDYLDLMMPASVKVSAENLFIKDKYVSEELRNLAIELNVLMPTASQLNRGSIEEIEFDHSHIAGGLSKIMSADNVFGIFTSRSMREKGKYQLQLMKTRSSSGVGQKIDLDFNVETLRISDPSDGTEQSPQTGPTPNDIMAKLKPTPYTDISQLGSEEPILNKHIVADVQGSKLKAMLQGLKR